MGYYKRPHNTLRQSPSEKWDSCPHPLKRITSERVLDLLLAPLPSNHGARTITQKGVSINGHWYSPADSNHAFWSRQGEIVNIKHDASGDAGFVMVYDRFGKFICEADCPELTGVSRIERVQKMKQLKRTQKIAQKDLTHLFTLDPETDIQVIVEKAKESIPADGFAVDQAHITLEHTISRIPLSDRSTAIDVEVLPHAPIPKEAEIGSSDTNTTYTTYRQEIHHGTRLEDTNTISFLREYESDRQNWYTVIQADLQYLVPPSVRTTRDYNYQNELAHAAIILTRHHHPSQPWRVAERCLQQNQTAPPIDPLILAALDRAQASPPYLPHILWAGCDNWLAKNLAPST